MMYVCSPGGFRTRLASAWSYSDRAGTNFMVRLSYALNAAVQPASWARYFMLMGACLLAWLVWTVAPVKWSDNKVNNGKL